ESSRRDSQIGEQCLGFSGRQQAGIVAVQPCRAAAEQLDVEFGHAGQPGLRHCKPTRMRFQLETTASENSDLSLARPLATGSCPANPALPSFHIFLTAGWCISPADADASTACWRWRHGYKNNSE